MKDVCVIIPARNEEFLAGTIERTLAAAEADTEIIAVLDGYWPDPPIPDHKNVTLIHHTEPVGQRAAVNEAARLTDAKFILKTDGHSMFDKGFDRKLMADCEYDWTVIPTMYNLHVFDWKCEWGCRLYQDQLPHGTTHEHCPKCGKEGKFTRDFVWKPRRRKRTDYMYIDSNLKVQYWYAYYKRPESKGQITDIMNGIGACWFQYRERFLELGGLDETHGGWGQVGVEVACKAWLSGGRHVVNKNTWFAHLFRTTSKFSFPYKLTVKQQRRAEEYSRLTWLGDEPKWSLAKHNFKWLVDKFHPVPTWDGKPDKQSKTVKAEDIAWSKDAIRPEEQEALNTFHTMFYERWNKRIAGFHPREWMGHKHCKYPTDLMIYQQILYKNKPDFLIECGTYRGGAALFFANMFDLIGKGQVIAVDMRPLRGRPKHKRITYLTGRSTSTDTLAKVRELVGDKTVMAVLDSNHKAPHVKRELHHYSGIVTPGQFMVCEDTYLDGHPIKPGYDKDGGPWAAAEWFLNKFKEYERVPVEQQYLLSQHPGGWLRRKKRA